MKKLFLLLLVVFSLSLVVTAQPRPVDPKPPSPRAVTSSALGTSVTVPGATSAIALGSLNTLDALKSPTRSTVTSAARFDPYSVKNAPGASASRSTQLYSKCQFQYS